MTVACKHAGIIPSVPVVKGYEATHDGAGYAMTSDIGIAVVGAFAVTMMLC